MRLSRIWRILQINEGVIHTGWICRILHISYSKPEFNNCFIIHSKYFPVLKGVSPFRLFRSVFPLKKKKTQYRPQVFSVNGSIICSWLHFRRHFDGIGSIICSGLQFWRHWTNMAKVLSKFGEQQLVIMSYACGFNQSETGKYFEWIINSINKFCYYFAMCLDLSASYAEWKNKDSYGIYVFCLTF